MVLSPVSELKIAGSLLLPEEASNTHKCPAKASGAVAVPGHWAMAGSPSLIKCVLALVMGVASLKAKVCVSVNL